MRKVEIEIFHIGQTRVNPAAVNQWLQHLGVSEEFRQYYDNDVCNECGGSAEEVASDPSLLVALAAKRCYNAFEPGINPNVTKVRLELTDYIDNILKSGHGSVLEHAVHTFAVEGVSRVFTAEMNRHRAGVAISEASMRYIRFNDIPFWEPLSIKLTEREQILYDKHICDSPKEIEELELEDQDALALADAKIRTQQVFERAFKQDEVNYVDLQEIWAKALAPSSAFSGKKQVTSMMRRIIPMGVATGAVYTLNLRALRHVLALRSTEHAEEEICHVAGRMLEMMASAEPLIFRDFEKIPGSEFWKPKYAKV